ncbi:MAG: hypothetical protein WAW80_01440 [Candidatus Saccharimonadales bacterium]
MKRQLASVQRALAVLGVGALIGLGSVVAGSGVANADPGFCWHGPFVTAGNCWNGQNGGFRGDGCFNGCSYQAWTIQVLSDYWLPGYESYWGSRGQVWVPPGPGQIVERNGTIFRVTW